MEQPLPWQKLLDEQLDSSGMFTLDARKALARLADSRLVCPDWWILKVVQASVAAGAGWIQLRGRREYHLEWGGLSWTPEDLERALCDPAWSPEAGLEHLRAGLWVVAIQQGRSFRIELAGQARGLLWDAAGPHRVEAVPGPQSRLWISACSGASDYSRILQALQERACTCPIPLTVNGRRLDALQADPSHGYSSDCCPFMVLTVAAEIEEFPVPLGTWKGFSARRRSSAQPALRANLPVPERIGAAALLSLHLRARGRPAWVPIPSPCTVGWVLDGVIIAQERLPVRDRPVALGMYLSAQGLGLDLSGFAFRESAASRERLERACRALTPVLASAHLELSECIGRARLLGYCGAGLTAMMGLGFLLTHLGVVEGVFSLFWAGAVPLQIHLAGQAEGILEDDHRRDLKQLQQEWSARYPADEERTSRGTIRPLKKVGP